MPCGHINAIRNIKKYKKNGMNLPALETKIGSTVYTPSNSYPKDKYSNKFNYGRTKMYLNNYVNENEVNENEVNENEVNENEVNENEVNVNENYNNYYNQFNVNHQNDSDYDTYGIAEEEDIEEIESSYNKKLYRDDKEIEDMLNSEDLFTNNNLSKTQTIDLKKLSKTLSQIKDVTGEDYINEKKVSKDDEYEWMRKKLPKSCYNQF